MPKSRVISSSLKFAALFLFVVAVAQADIVGFTEYYDPSNWVMTKIPAQFNCGAVITSPDRASAVISPGSSCWTPGGTWGYGTWSGLITWTIAAPASGEVRFDWQWFSDHGGEHAGYLVNGVYSMLATIPPPDQSGTGASFHVESGDVFGFYANALDAWYYAGYIRISNFSAPDTGIPEPATLLLVGGPLVLVGLRRRRH